MYSMDDTTSPPAVNVVVPIGLAAVTLNTIGSIYVIYRTLKRWIVTKRPLSMSFRVPMYIAFTDLFLCCANIINLSYTMEHGVTFQGIACKVVGGLSFFGVSNNMSLVGSIALLTYLRTCKKWTIDLGKYDYKLFAIISLLSFTLTLIGVPSFGPSGYWCYTNQVNPTIPIIIIVLNFMIIFITVFCYIATLLEVNFRNKVVQKLGNKSRLSRLEIIVARKITGYILIFILQWTPTMFYVIGQICGYDKIWMYTLTEVAGNSGGVGNMLLFLINEKWRDNFDSLHDNSNSNSNPKSNLNSKNHKEQSSSETLTERSDEYINDGNITPSKIKVHEIVTVESKEIL